MMVAAEKRWFAVSGVAFAVLFVAGALSLGELAGSVGDSNATFVSYYDDEANRARDIAGAYLLAAAGLAFLWFLTSLRRLLRTPGDDTSMLPTIVLVAGIAFVSMLFAAGAALSTVNVSITFGAIFDEHGVLGGSEMAVLPQLGYVLMHLYGAFAASLMIAAASLAGSRGGVFPAWLVWLGLIAAVLLLFAIASLPIFALPVWVLAVSIAVLRRDDAAMRPRSATVASKLEGE
jgi:hypothetical protein